MPTIAATLRTPDLPENNPDHSRDRYERLREFVNKQCNRRVTFIAWIPTPGATASEQGAWGGWFDRPAPNFCDVLIEADVVVASS